MRKHFERPVYVLLIICLLLTENNAKRELRLLGLLPMTGDGWSGGIACLPAIEMALEDVNADDSILKTYELVYKTIDSKCDPQISLYRMLEALYNDKPYTMILGAGCSVASEATAKITHLWNLTQLSYASSSPTLSDRKKFPRFFRLALPDQKLNAARIDLMRKFDWTKVATIHQALDIFSAITDDFVKSVQDTNITIISQPVFSNDPRSSVKKLKKLDARIIMTAMYEDKAREVLCAAYKVGLYGPKMVWVFVGWFSTTFWKYHLDGVNCTEEEMDKAAEGSFITGPAYSNPVDERGIANMTVSEFEARFHNYSSYNKSNTVYDFYAPQCYDHVWVAAKALECADKRLREQDHGKGLEEFTYNDTATNEIIFQCMENTSLTGVSGRVMFSSDGDPKRVVKMERIQDSVRQDIGLYRQDKDPKYFEWIDGAIKWKDGTVPRDSTVVKNVERGIPTILYGTMAVLSGLGINITIALFIFNVIYRNNRFVKLSSPNINNILLLGCVICYATVFIKTTDIVNVAMCKIRIFCLSLGFTVTFGALFAKTWRVYRIFTNKKLLKRAIKDYQLMAIIGGMVAVILFIIILWETICPHEIKVKFLHKEVYMTGNDTEARPYVRVCRSGNSDIFEWILYISQGALLIFGAFLAFETREVKIKALNDSHQIGLCIYNVLVLSAVALTLSLILEDQEVLMYGITSACLILGTSMTEMIIFIPKIQSVLGKTDISDTPTGTGTGAISTNPSQEMPSKVVSTEI